MNSQTFMKAKYFNACWSNERNKIQKIKKHKNMHCNFGGFPDFSLQLQYQRTFSTNDLFSILIQSYSFFSVGIFYECIKLMFPRCNVAYRYVFLLRLYFILCFEIQGRDCHLFAWVAWNNLSFSRISYITQAHSICESVYINMRQIIIYSTDMAVKLVFASVTMKI